MLLLLPELLVLVLVALGVLLYRGGSVEEEEATIAVLASAPAFDGDADAEELEGPRAVFAVVVVAVGGAMSVS